VGKTIHGSSALISNLLPSQQIQMVLGEQFQANGQFDPARLCEMGKARPAERAMSKTFISIAERATTINL
jgi:hypothetical protein